MSFYRDTNVVYYNNQVVNNTLKTIEASILQRFPIPFIQDASNYVIVVERLELNTNGIPFYDPLEEPDNPVNVEDNIFVLTVTDLSNTKFTLDLTGLSFGLHDFSINLNTAFQEAVSPYEIFNDFTMDIDIEGFAILTVTNGAIDNLTNIQFPTLMRNILGIRFEDKQSTTDPKISKIKSIYPRYDMGNLAPLIRLVTDLPLVSDMAGRSTVNMATDLIQAGGTITVSRNVTVTGGQTSFSQTVNTSPKQLLVYSSPKNRYLNMQSQSPINSIYLRCDFVLADGQTRRVLLPPGGRFNIKLAFYRRV